MDFNALNTILEKATRTPVFELFEKKIAQPLGFEDFDLKNQQYLPFVGTFSARGAGEQNLIVIPSKKMIIVHMTEVNSPNDPMMKVTDFGRMVKVVME